MTFTPTDMLFFGALLLAVGWAACSLYAKFKPSKRAIALKLGVKAIKQLAALQSSTPEALAAAAASQAHEEALMKAFKDAALELK